MWTLALFCCWGVEIGIMGSTGIGFCSGSSFGISISGTLCIALHSMQLIDSPNLDKLAGISIGAPHEQTHSISELGMMRVFPQSGHLISWQIGRASCRE